MLHNLYLDKYDVAAGIYLADIGQEKLLLEQYSYELLVTALDTIWSKKAFYLNVFEHEGQNSLYSYAIDHAIAVQTHMATSKKGAKLTEDQKYLITYHVHGWIGCMIDWLKGKLPYTAKELADLEYRNYPAFITEVWS